MKTKIFFVFMCSAVVFGITSCTDFNDINQKWLDSGEQTYVGKVDSLKVRGGNKRVQIVGLMNYAQTADRCVIRWFDGLNNDSVTVPSSTWQSDGVMRKVIDNLDEGTYTFSAMTYDKEGHRSVNVVTSGYAYGERYAHQAAQKIITNLRPEPEGMYISWNQTETALSVEMQYDKSSNETETILLPGNVAETVVEGWKKGGVIRFRTGLLPEENALDTIYTDWNELTFPVNVEFAVSKTNIKHLVIPYEATTGYSGAYTGVFDDIIRDGANQFHSGSGAGVPQHLTFDLGLKANLTRFELWARDDGYNNWNPRIIQIWGIEDITGAEIPLASADAGWESKALSLGWTKMTENTCPVPVYNKLTINNPAKVRYIIVRTKEVHGAPATGSGAYTILREISLFADDITK
ncbi:MAG: hypothetical protein LBD53_11750 [Tannerella sp.]|jgi:hypothetical protein|nr:hypothetical protein [Tannerella sp.]